VNIRANAEKLANGTEVCGLQQECALLHVEFSLQQESALERISFALDAVAEADANFYPFQRKFSASGMKTNSHSGACSERRAKKIIGIGTGRYVAGSIWAADGKLSCVDTTNQRAVIGGVARDDNFADLGHD
jgi:hypothetical protein